MCAIYYYKRCECATSQLLRGFQEIHLRCTSTTVIHVLKSWRCKFPMKPEIYEGAFYGTSSQEEEEDALYTTVQ